MRKHHPKNERIKREYFRLAGGSEADELVER